MNLIKAIDKCFKQRQSNKENRFKLWKSSLKAVNGSPTQSACIGNINQLHHKIVLDSTTFFLLDDILNKGSNVFISILGKIPNARWTSNKLFRYCHQLANHTLCSICLKKLFQCITTVKYLFLDKILKSLVNHSVFSLINTIFKYRRVLEKCITANRELYKNKI